MNATLTRNPMFRMEEYGGSESISASPSAPELPGLDMPDRPRPEAYNPFDTSGIENQKKISLDMGNTLESRAIENIKKSSSSLCRSLENLNTTGCSTLLSVATPTHVSPYK